MSESDGMDDVLDNGMRQALLMASRLAETLARRRQESLRQQEHRDAQAAHEAGTRLAAERSAARAALAPVEKDQWWDKAQPHDIAAAHAVAEGWKDHDPAALAASERIRQEVLTRYAIDTHDVGADGAYLESYIQTTTTEKARQDALAASHDETRKAAAEHEKAMVLLAAARAEELRTQAQKLAPEMERHQVPVEYLANPELARALQRVHNAKTPNAVAAAETEIKERLYLIGKDGINGPDIDQLRQETAATVNGADDSHFKDPAFVKAAKDMRETRLLAEGGFTGSQSASMEQRYERAEKELFARLEGVGRDIENRVAGNDSSRRNDRSLKRDSTSAVDYGSAERQEAFAASLATSGANETQIRGRVAAERSEGAHPSAAVATSKGVAKARKARGGPAMGAERGRSSPSR
ncbi:hypothetical protein E4J89_17275 [Arthrobacter sp. CAU 1506]|uniref:hypothetical protein n=1 Tax=Arthrobacter sp. CAU 1506 TaxID=2560052 RepID=UPI0010AD9FAA|nr:hypothetical protein [Arthrobacter sp. CAU 1506]TJY66229.1 hypothetical protein E4J89_17275 [Arthrobacter sp. CAU 1506]